MASRSVARSVPKPGSFIRTQDDRGKKSFVIKSRAGYQGSPGIASKLLTPMREYPTVPTNSYGVTASKKPDVTPIVVSQPELPKSPEKKLPLVRQSNQPKTEKTEAPLRVINVRRQSSGLKQPASRQQAAPVQPAQTGPSLEDKKQLEQLMARKRELETMRDNLDNQIIDENKRNSSMSEVSSFKARNSEAEQKKTML